MSNKMKLLNLFKTNDDMFVAAGAHFCPRDAITPPLMLHTQFKTFEELKDRTLETPMTCNHCNEKLDLKDEYYDEICLKITQRVGEGPDA